MTCKSVEEIVYYINITINNNLNKRQLQEIISNHDYDMLSEDVKIKISNFDELTINDLVPNPILIKSNQLKIVTSEYALKQSILDSLDDFLKKLGIGFTYVANEYKISLGDRNNYIDLLLYNVKYK